MLPFSYAIRHLLRDPARFAQKVAGAALVVFLMLAAGSFNSGMKRVLTATGSPLNVILLGAGSEESVERSEVAVRAEVQATAGIRGIASRLGQPAVSGEVQHMGLVRLPGGIEGRAIFRGITPAALEVHREVRLIEGSYPRSGEVMVGLLAHEALGTDAAALAVGGTIEVEEHAFTIAGRFEAPGTVMESEIWFDRNDLMTAIKRDKLSCVVIRVESAEHFKNADLFCKQRLDLELVALRESDYYGKLAAFYGPLRGMTWLTAALIGAGAVFGGLNILYAAFASRIRELATLQAIGFGRGALLFSMVQESLVSALVGTLLAAFLAILLIEGVTIPFSIGAFHLALPPTVIGAGLLTGFFLGCLGALPPALRCLRAPLPTALRSA